MKAICLPYTVDQNEPSVPIKQIITLPDDVRLRDKMLKELFIAHVCDVSIQDLEIYGRSDEHEFGDLTVAYEDSMFLYVTYVV